MKGLKIEIKNIQQRTGSKWIGYPVIGLFILIGLCLLPLLIMFWIFGTIYNLITPNKPIENEYPWKVIKTGTDHLIRYKWANVDDMPEYIYKYFDTQPLLIFDTNPKVGFFEGYFTAFKVERSDGIFLQKVIQDNEKDEIKALPLYFFNYTTQELNKIKDLKGYEIDSKGSPNDFIISAVAEEDEFEIRIRKE